MNLTDFLSGKGRAPKEGTTDWLPFCTIDITSGALWAGDPYVVSPDDGCVVKVPPGKYVVQALATSSRRHRTVARLHVRLAAAKTWKLGREAGRTGTDSAMIGVCDIKAYGAALKRAGVDAAMKAIAYDVKRGRGFGVVRLERKPGAVMPFVPTGSDGVGPVLPLISGGKRVGIELSFMGDDSTETPEASLLGTDKPDFRTWPLAGGGEATCWVGGHFEAGRDVGIWSSAPRGPVLIRIRRGESVLKEWMPLKKKRGGGAAFGILKKFQPGKYEIDFQIGEQTFSAVEFNVK